MIDAQHSPFPDRSGHGRGLGGRYINYNRMKIMNFIIFIFLSVLLASCKTDTPNPPYVYENEPEFTWGYAQFYGNYYSNYNLNNNVLTVNLFTDGLSVNENNELVGTGQYLILEDVFVAPLDSVLTAGTYTISAGGEPLTFFSGIKYEENNQEVPSGAYIYYIEQDVSKSKIVYIKDGTFTVSRQGISGYSIDCRFVTNEKTEIKGRFNANLIFFDESAIPPAPNSAIRHRIKIRR